MSKEKGLLDNALIVLVSDHGEMLGDRDHRFSKYCLYEGSVRIPMLLSGSAVPAEQRGTVDQRPAELVDIWPTLARQAGQAVDPGLPGGDLLGPPVRVGSFCEMHGAGSRMEPSQRAPALMWRKQDWKLIIHQPGSVGDAALRPEDITGELYHLAEDPHEHVNLYKDEAHAAIREKLTLELMMYQAQFNARWPRHFYLRDIPVNPPEDLELTCPRFGVQYWY